MKYPGAIMDTLLEINIAALIFLFPFIHIGTGRLFNTLWSVLLILWALSLIIQRRRIPLPASAPLLLLFAGILVVAGMLSEEAGMRLKGLSYMLQGTALFFAVYDFYRRQGQRAERTLAYLLISASLVSVDAVIQVLLGKDILGIPLALSRATAFFIHPFYLSLWSGIGLFIALALLMKTHGRFSRPFAGLSLLVLSAAFLFSKTRAAWVAVAVLILIALISIPDRKRLSKFLIPGLSIPVVLLLADQALRARFFSIFTATDPRLTIWTQSWTMIRDTFGLKNWIIGRGPGLFRSEYPGYDLIRGGETFPHMIALELLYAAGILGVIAFAAWLVHYLVTLRPAENFPSGRSHQVFVRFIPLLVFAVCLINESFFSRYFSFLFWFTAGLSAAYAENTQDLPGMPG